MEMTSLVTIAVVTAVGTATTVTVTAVLKWLGSLAKTAATNATTKAAIKKTLNRNIFLAVWNTSWLLVCSWLLFKLIRDPSPPKRIDVFSIVIVTLGVALYASALAFQLGQLSYRRTYKRAPK
jgi:hypothetical protein